MTMLEALGTWVASTSPSDVPEEARTVASRAILDAVGVTLAAHDGEVAALMDAFLADSGAPQRTAATVIGRSQPAPPEAAALVNGTIGHALDYDDSNEAMGGHPTVAVFPATLAAAEMIGASGRELLTGYVLGVETAAALGRGLNYEHYELGWHPTATLGAFGAAAGACHVLGLDAPAVSGALALTASLAAGVKANFGSHAKPIQAGRAAQNGLFAARLAAAGAAGNPAAFEGAQGFVATHQGLGSMDLEAMGLPPERPWELLTTGISYKRFPCCASTHGAVEAALGLHAELDDQDVGIEEVRIWTHPRRLQHTNRATVATGFEAKFSVQYTVAVALARGHVGLADFEPDALARTDVTALMERTTAAPMPNERHGSDHYAAEVEVVTATGRTIRERVERPRGLGKEGGLSEEELLAKFFDCAGGGGLSDGHARALATTLLELESLDDLGELRFLLAAG